MPLSLLASGLYRLRREIQARREPITEPGSWVPLRRSRSALSSGADARRRERFAYQREGRALVTLDLDFANIQRYPPGQYSGIMVLRLGTQAHEPVATALANAIALLKQEPLSGRLWIVEVGRVRIHD